MKVKVRLVRSSASVRVATVTPHDPEAVVLLGCRFTTSLTVCGGNGSNVSGWKP